MWFSPISLSPFKLRLKGDSEIGISSIFTLDWYSIKIHLEYWQVLARKMY